MGWLALENVLRCGVNTRERSFVADAAAWNMFGGMRWRDEVDYLPENGVYCLRCFLWGCFHNPVGYRKSPADATLNFQPFANAVSEWDANVNKRTVVYERSIFRRCG